MLFGMSAIIMKWSHSLDLLIFQYSCFKIDQSQPRVAYKRVACKRKIVCFECNAQQVIFFMMLKLNEVF